VPSTSPPAPPTSSSSSPSSNTSPGSSNNNGGSGGLSVQVQIIIGVILPSISVLVAIIFGIRSWNTRESDQVSTGLGPWPARSDFQIELSSRTN
jgi:hypothetical protein